MMTQIITERLILISLSDKIADCILHGDYTELEKLDIHIHHQWPLQDTLDILSFIAANKPTDHETCGFDDWMVVRTADRSIIGDAGFKGGPDVNGAIEIGFGLVSEEWRKGYGFEAANALIEWAFSQEGIRLIKADCLPDNRGSLRILEKCGMHEIGRDDELIHWEIVNPSYVFAQEEGFF